VDELKETNIDDKVRTLTSLLKKDDVPKSIGTEPFSKAHTHAEVLLFLTFFDLLEFNLEFFAFFD
jgi:hypothetical protein